MSYTIDHSHDATAFTRGRQGHRIKYIVVHHWDDPAKHPTFEGTIRWFERGGNNTSAHYVAEAGRVAQLVADGNTAYHAGNWVKNLESIGIECNPRCNEADKATVAELIRDLQAKHGPLTILGHKDCTSTDCPGRYYPPTSVLAPWLGGGGGAGNAKPATTTTAPSGDLNALADAVLRGDYGNGEERKRRLGSKYSAVQAIVNQRLGYGSATTSAGPDLNALADAVIRGEFGNGDERRRRLGANYAAEQRIVNRKLGY
ncbi:N-acetylmuramoyl-L-alanine amidase [Rothia sp. ZJ1223]|uniref:N-acetylmuramoyl-L-alanine amidase n=1 Tax=Rothia sp. ZJ1223 TaxID=2811098 RepID=UPI00195DD419|nr:N-acetylmuramoyl-L-alanine amidase [Rothia sp. ZJ1223]MBM7051706.1 N-acetylmuramoyl-L-alanine amidase [Rothia sp. ZJ1223]